VWSYLFRRLLLMIPTLFGVTVISFVIMQCAPGDPLLSQLGSSGNASQAGQTPEAFREMKRDLKLDKPLVLNFNYFRDYSQPVRIAAYYRAQTSEQIATELPQLAAAGNDPLLKSRLNFLRDLGIPDFDERMKKPETYPHLARAIDGYVQRWCEDAGEYAVPATMEILDDKQSDLRLQIGAIRALASMTVDPFPSTLPQDPTPADLERVESIWNLWWTRNQKSFEKLDADAQQAVQKAIADMSHLKSRSEVLDGLDYLERDQAPAFIESLLGKSSPAEKEIAIMALRKTIGAPLEGDVALDATPEQVAQVAENWRTYYASHAAQYHPDFGRRLWSIVADTQYSYMLVRLATFQFGHSAMKLREPVSQLIWEALLVSVPLMFMAEAVIYLIAVPLGIWCAVDRGGWWDRSISFGLFILYSIPPFVAGMILLLLFCYGDYLKWFPMEGLHSDDADQMSFVPFILDYLWHAALPVVCLSLFSLASMAMFSRSAMLDCINQDYIRTARAKGLSSASVIWKHALRNSLIPIITLFASFLPALLGGSVLIEVLFNIPGMGRLSWMSISKKDFPTLMALVFIEAIVVMVSILLADVLYVIADPRISFDSREDGR
jgi:peptide/nickel transport system permease protein